MCSLDNLIQIWSETGELILSNQLPTLVVSNIIDGYQQNTKKLAGTAWEEQRELNVIHSIDNVNFKTIIFKEITSLPDVIHIPPALTLYHPETEKIVFTTSRVPLNIVDTLYITEHDSSNDITIKIPENKKYGVLFGAESSASVVTIISEINEDEYFVRERKRFIRTIFSNNHIRFSLTETVESYFVDYPPSNFDAFVRTEAYIVDLTSLV
ncbi:hypothetical protein [Acinetobacter sp. A47]|uniref:hypothetical protein n=1 Tax=Acinetobacter sp. A47 TaxID=1561217 RepID=UPI0005706B6C|nr:hypothetical protein [Acinetobacter sp. A47]